MHFNLKIGIILLLILVVALIITLFTKSNNDYGVLYFNGLVYVDKGDGIYKPADNEMKIYEGYSIKTGNNTNATIIFYDLNSITLSSNTEIKIERVSNESISIFQKLGETWSKVERLSGIKAYEVKDQNVAALVRGTSFLFSSDLIAVDEGIVEVKDNEKRLNLENAEYNIKNGQKTSINLLTKKKIKDYVKANVDFSTIHAVNKLIKQAGDKNLSISQDQKNLLLNSMKKYFNGAITKEELKNEIKSALNKDNVSAMRAVNLSDEKELDEIIEKTQIIEKIKERIEKYSIYVFDILKEGKRVLCELDVGDKNGFLLFDGNFIYGITKIDKHYGFIKINRDDMSYVSGFINDTVICYDKIAQLSLGEVLEYKLIASSLKLGKNEIVILDKNISIECEIYKESEEEMAKLFMLMNVEGIKMCTELKSS